MSLDPNVTHAAAQHRPVPKACGRCGGGSLALTSTQAGVSWYVCRACGEIICRIVPAPLAV